jgi:hypothetical protein
VCGEDDPSSPPIERLRTAVFCGDAATAMTAFDAFMDPDLSALRADTALLRDFVTLVEDPLAPGILRRVRPPEDVWLELAAGALPGANAALQEVLWDLGVRDPRGLVPFTARLLALPAIGNANVLAPILARGAAADALAAFDDDATAAALRGWFGGASPLIVLPRLADDGAGVLTTIQASPAAQVWLFQDPIQLGARIPVWGVGDWWRALHTMQKRDLLLLMITVNPAGWGPGLRDSLTAQGPAVTAPPTPGEPLGVAVLRSVASVDKAAAGRLVALWAWPLVLAVPIAAGSGWLDAAAALAMVNAPGATIDSQADAARNPVVAALFAGTGGSAFDLFPLLVADPARFAQAAGANPLLLNWVVGEAPRLKEHIEQGGQFGPWAGALVRGGHVTRLLGFAKDHGDDWRAGINGAALFPTLLGALPARLPDEDAFRGFMNLWGDGAGRTGAEAITAFTHLAGARIQPPGEETNFEDFTGRKDPAAPNTSPRRYDLRAIWMPLAPTDAAMLELMRMLSPMTLNEVATTRTLAFVENKVYRWKQTAPVVSSGWHDFTPAGAGNRSIETSYAWDGNVVMYSPRTLGGAPNPSGMDTTASDADANGVGRMVGGGERRGRQDNRTLGDTSLTYFQNHARHEFGHSVGASQYPGLQKGDDAALAYAGWTAVSDADFQAAMWNAGGSVRLTVGAAAVQVHVPAVDVAAWATQLLKSGQEPRSGNVLVDDPNISPMSTDDKLALLQSSRFGRQRLLLYLVAVRKTAGSFAEVPSAAYEFPGYTPGGNEVHIYAERGLQSFAKYSRAAYNALVRTHGWYCLASPAEMFAEIYTKHYSGGATPRALGGVDWADWFRRLEAAGPATTPAGPGIQATDPTAGAAVPVGTGETAPSTRIIEGR